MSDERRTPAGEPPRDAPDGEFINALEEDRFAWREYGPEDYVTLVVFWLLAVDVFLQFFSRYVLGDSIAWTEEMARYLLILVCFLGGSMAVRKNSHIMIEFFYRYLPDAAGRWIATLVDIVRCVFFAAVCWVTFQLAERTHSMMVSVDIPKRMLYYVVLAGFVLMLVRSLQLLVRHWRGATNALLFSDDEMH